MCSFLDVNRTTVKWFVFLKNVLVWVSPEADLKATTQVQIVYLDVRETLVQEWGRENTAKKVTSVSD